MYMESEIKESVINEKFKWYALYCASNQEKSTKINIERELRYNGLSEYVSRIEVPMDKVMINVKGKKVAREKILLPCYIFMYADVSNGEVLPIVRKSKGVLGFINPSDGKTRLTPEALKISEVEKFLKITEKSDTNDAKLFVGDRVKIIGGPFTSFVGVIDMIDINKKIVKVLVSIFTRETTVEVEFNQVEKEIKKV